MIEKVVNDLTEKNLNNFCEGLFLVLLACKLQTGDVNKGVEYTRELRDLTTEIYKIFKASMDLKKNLAS